MTEKVESMEQMKLKIEVLEKAGINNPTEEDVERFEKCDFLTENAGRDGKTYYWYCDGDGFEAAACVETGEFLNKEQIESLLV